MIIRKSVMAEKEVIEDILCNKCGKSLLCGMNFNGLEKVIVIGQYDSTHLVDCQSYEFSLCEGCLVELFNSFKIEPTTNEEAI